MAPEDDIFVLKLVNTTSNVNGHILSAHQIIPKQIFVNDFGHFAIQKYHYSIHHCMGHLSMSQGDNGHACLLSSHNCLCWLADVSIMTVLQAVKCCYLIHCGAVIMQSVFPNILQWTPHSTPIRARSAVSIKSDQHSATVIAVPYVKSWKIEPYYNGTKLYIHFHVSTWPHSSQYKMCWLCSLSNLVDHIVALNINVALVLIIPPTVYSGGRHDPWITPTFPQRNPTGNNWQNRPNSRQKVKLYK